MKFAVIDVETTGLNPVSDKVIELGIVFTDGITITGEKSYLFQPGRNLPAKIRQLTGIDDRLLHDCPAFDELASEIVEITEGCVLVGHHVSFDYSFLRNEMKLSGFTFTRKTLCTAELSRYLFPGSGSHSLASVCKRMGVINTRAHRALPDAQATANVLQAMLPKLSEGFVKALFRNHKNTTHIPAHLKQYIQTELPEAPGIYYFIGRNNRPLYIGKAANLKSRVTSHFRGEGNSLKILALGARIKKITYQLAGSELMATLMEDHEIRHYWPELNNAQKQPPTRFGVVFYKDQLNTWRMNIARGGKEYLFLATFHRYHLAYDYIKGLVSQYHLDPSKCGMAGTFESDIYSHNNQFNLMIEEVQNKRLTEIYFTQGRTEDELGYILLQNCKYKGIGFLPAAEKEVTSKYLEYLRPQRSSITTESIILKLKDEVQPDWEGYLNEKSL